MALELNRIITGDCRDILPTLPDKSFQLAFADPPYWVGFDYGDKTDAEMAYVDPKWLVSELQRIANFVIVTPGNGNVYIYPECKWFLGWFKPGATRRSKLNGFCIFEPILVYGTLNKPFYNDAIILADCANHAADCSWHTCPKPLALLKWLILNSTEPGDSVLDPFSGSGTTCKAALELGRNYLGIEIDPTFAEKSRQRLSNTTVDIPGLLTDTTEKQLELDNILT